MEEGIVPGGGVALLRSRRILRELTGTTLDEMSGICLVERALEEPLRRIERNVRLPDPVQLTGQFSGIINGTRGSGGNRFAAAAAPTNAN